MLQQDKAWIAKPKPKVAGDANDFERAEHWIAAQNHGYALIHLTRQTDSTRVIVLSLGEHGPQHVPDLEIGHHDASHHGKDAAKIEQFARYEEKKYRNLAGFLDKLQATNEQEHSLLEKEHDRFGSNTGVLTKLG